jgi:tetratricopeptide (TPR) repeat protein
LAFIKFTQNELNKAIKLYSDAIEINPESVNAYAMRGLSYVLLGKELEALSNFEKVPLNDSFNQCIVNVGKGIVSYLSDNVYQALAYYDEAIKLDPQNPMGYVNRGMLKFEMRDPTADEDLLHANKAGGQFAGKDANTIYTYIKLLLMKDVGRARMVATFSVKMHPNSSILWECLSVVHYMSQEPEKSIEAANRAIELNALNERAWYFRAFSKLMMGDKRGCEKDIELATDLFGESAFIYTIAAACEYKNISAEEYYEKALAIDPDNSTALFAKGGLLYSKGEKGKAVEYFRRAYENGSIFTESESIEFSEIVMKHLKPSSEKGDVDQDNTENSIDRINTEFAPNRKYQNFHFEAFQGEYDKEKNQQIAYDNICRQYPNVLDPDKFDSFIIQYRQWNRTMR